MVVLPVKMAPPTFNDMNKSVKDLFNKGYTHGFLKFESTTNASNNVEFKTGANHNLTSQKIGGNFSVKYKNIQHGLTFTEKWTTDNVLGAIVEVNDQFAKNLKVTLDTTYIPHSAKRGGVIKAEWTKDLLKLNSELTLQDGPVLTLSGVTTRENWLCGIRTKFDILSNEFKGTSVAFGRKTPEYDIHSYTNDGREFGASFFHKAHRDVEVGAQMNWTVGDQAARFGLATKYQPNDNMIIRTKVDNNAQVAFALTHDLGRMAKLTLSTQFGLLNDSPHKFGLGLEYTPKL